MVPFQIKICGVTSVSAAEHAWEKGADAIGLNFYVKSSRYISQALAKNIVVSASDFSAKENRSVLVVGVFVNEPIEALIKIANKVGLGCVQLHGDEQPSDVAEIRQGLTNADVKIIRAIRTQPAKKSAGRNVGNSEPSSVGDSETEPIGGDDETDVLKEINRIETEIENWSAAGIDAVLLDAAIAGEFGGTGKTVDWVAFSKLKSRVPIVLAGGLTADNVEEAIRISNTRSVDVASGVESSPGQKDDQKVNRFIANASRALE